MLKYVKQWKFFYEFCICAYFLLRFWIFQTIGPKFSGLGAFKRLSSFLAKQLNVD